MKIEAIVCLQIQILLSRDFFIDTINFVLVKKRMGQLYDPLLYSIQAIDFFTTYGNIIIH